MERSMGSKPHLLIAVDAFKDAHIEAIARAVDNWATWERISDAANPTARSRNARTSVEISLPVRRTNWCEGMYRRFGRHWDRGGAPMCGSGDDRQRRPERYVKSIRVGAEDLSNCGPAGGRRRCGSYCLCFTRRPGHR